MSLDAGVEYTIPGEFPAEQIVLPWEFLSDCEGKSDEPVTIESSGQRTLVKWRDGNVPQQVQYPVRICLNKNFRRARTMGGESSQVAQALADACQTTDPESVRFALGSIQLQGRPGKIVATDGRQLLTQSGFQFDWAKATFSYRQIGSTAVGSCPMISRCLSAGRKLVFAAGRVVDVFTSGSTRVPVLQVKDLVPRKASITARFEIPAPDRVFLAQELAKRCPASRYNWPVTVDLGGKVVLRSRQSGQAGVTELVLSRSARTGEAAAVSYQPPLLLGRPNWASSMCNSSAPKRAPYCAGPEHRQYLWALLDPESWSTRPTRPSASKSVADKADLQRPATRRKTSQMTSAGKRAAAPCHSQGEHSGTAEEAAAARAIDQAVALT